MEKIIKKHWNVLKTDPILENIIPKRPRFIYKRAPNLRQELINNVVDPPKVVKELEGGFVRCGRCVCCRTTGGLRPTIRNFRSRVTDQLFDCRTLTTCATKNVIYLLQCPCGIQYIGKTKRTLKTRISEHIRNIKKQVMGHSVSNHFSVCQKGCPEGLSFCIVEQVKNKWRGGNIERELAQKEMFWAYTLKTFAPQGLNIELDLNSFIDNSQ